MGRGLTWLILILLVAFALRLTAAVAVQQHVGDQLCLIAGDAHGYWDLARQIAAGHEFSLYDPPRQIHRMPGFPALLAISQTLFGNSTLAARCVLAIVGTLACGAVYLLGRRLCDEQTALLACALTAISPAMVGFSVLLLSETLFAATLTLSLWLAANWLAAGDSGQGTGDRGQVSACCGLSPVSCLLSPATCLWALATGVGIAVATYVRPSWLLAGPVLAVLAVWLAKDRRRTALEAAVMLLGLFVAMSPWAYRNHSICGHWVFTTLWSGASLYDGLSPAATGESDMQFFDRDNLMASRSEYDVDQHYKSAAWQFAKQNPRSAVELTLIKLWRYWKPWPSARQFGALGPALLVAGFFVPVVALACVGGWRVRHQPWAWLLTAGPILYFAAIHAVFVGSLRYRLPAEYALCVLAAVGLKGFRVADCGLPSGMSHRPLTSDL